MMKYILACLSWCSFEMDVIVMALVIASILLGAVFLYPRSSTKGTTSNIFLLSLYYIVFSFTFFIPIEGATTSVHPKPSREAVKVYTKEEVFQHNTKKDCWIIVKGKVYDVTPYVEEHPGGDAILNNAGGDSTDGFYGPQHATRVFDMVDEFYIGDLES